MRITVTIIARVWPQLVALIRATRQTRGEVVNRAIGIYALVTRAQEAGEDVVLRDVKTGEEKVLHIL